MAVISVYQTDPPITRFTCHFHEQSLVAGSAVTINHTLAVLKRACPNYYKISETIMNPLNGVIRLQDVKFNNHA
jgi:hypothetical protein